MRRSAVPRVAARQALERQLEHPRERGRAPRVARREPRAQPERIRGHRAPAALVPRADLLADVAAEPPVALPCAQRARGSARAARSSCTRGSASRRARRARETRPVGHASRHARQLPQWSGSGARRREREVGEHDAEEEIGAEARVDQAGVLADPAEPGLGRERALEHRARVDVAARAHGRAARAARAPPRARARGRSARRGSRRRPHSARRGTRCRRARGRAPGS